MPLFLLSLSPFSTRPVVVDGLTTALVEAADEATAKSSAVALDERLPDGYFDNARVTEIDSDTASTSYQGGLFGSSVFRTATFYDTSDPEAFPGENPPPAPEPEPEPPVDPPVQTTDATDFDGVMDEFDATTLSTVPANSTKTTGLIFFRFDGAGQAIMLDALTGVTTNLRVFTEASNLVEVDARNASGLRIRLNSGSTVVNDAAWHSLLYSWDLDVPGSERFYLDDVDVKTLGPGHGGGTGGIDFSAVGDWRVGATAGATPLTYWPGCMAKIWLDFNSYFDFDDEAERRKFIRSDNKPVDLGVTGQLPTGSDPHLYFNNPFGSFQTNLGTAVNAATATKSWTVSGALTACSDSPSD